MNKERPAGLALPDHPHLAWWLRPGFLLPRLIIITITAHILAMCSGPVPAHDAYSELKVPNTNSSCCDDRDCREVPWREVQGEIEFLVEGFWLRPQRHNLLPPIDDRAHACFATPSPGVAPVPRCLVLPAMGA